jgi:hypothetical protein
MPRLNGSEGAVDEPVNLGRYRFFATAKLGGARKRSPMIPTKLPMHLAFVEILASISEVCFLLRRIHVEGRRHFLAFGELVRSH